MNGYLDQLLQKKYDFEVANGTIPIKVKMNEEIFRCLCDEVDNPDEIYGLKVIIDNNLKSIEVQ